jgi:hypothetical protein
MKKSILLFSVFLYGFVFFVKGQINLVVNPSFEDTISCPTSNSQISNAYGWMSLCGSPDFYHKCSGGSFNVGVPNNWAGYQFPASGNAYAGFATYSNSAPNAREFPACVLSSPLNIGTKYFVSFKVSLTLTSNVQANCASDKIGALFTTSQYICNSIINNAPPIYTDSIISDSLNWVRIFGSFVADSAYNNIVIGNFFDDSNTDTLKFFNDFTDNAYYYLDDVCVSTDSAFAYNYVYNTSIPEMTSQNQITFFPNPVIENLNIKNSFNEPIDIYIYNVFGELIYSVKNINHKILSVNLPHTQKGLLLVNIKSQSINYKLLKL